MTRGLRPRDPNTATFTRPAARRATPAAMAGFGLGLAALAVMIVLAFRDGPGLMPFSPGVDKLQHLAAFATLGFLFAIGRSARALAVTAFLLCGGAFAIEALQPLVTETREASFGDALASCAGAGLGLLAAASLNLIGAALSRGPRARAT